jgi:hypothetical protein
LLVIASLYLIERWIKKWLNSAIICVKITSQNQTEHRLVCMDHPSSGQAKGKKPNKEINLIKWYMAFSSGSLKV